MSTPARNIQRRSGNILSTKDPGSGSASSAVSSSSTNLEWWSNEESRLYEQWASSYAGLQAKFNNPYFDYFYSGQDVIICIEGLNDPDDKLCIYAFGYSIQQQKQPVYGYASYTYDGMLRGTRIITGAFSVVTDEPHGINRRIAKAAKIRAEAANSSKIRLNKIHGLDEDEANIDRYWRRHYDANLDVSQQHLFSIHPPFNFLIRYGLQTTSLAATNPEFRSEDIRRFYKNQPALYTDYNERLVPHATKELEHRILLENVELTSKSIEYNVEGDPILETYTFMARDERLIIEPDHSQMAPMPSNPQTGTSGSRTGKLVY